MSSEDFRSSGLVDILSSEDLPAVIESSSEASYPACDHSRYELIESRSSRQGSYWRRCQVCRKMAAAPVKPRVFRRKHRGQSPHWESAEVPVAESVRRTPLVFSCREYSLEYTENGQKVLRIKGHVIEVFLDFDALLVYLKRRGLPYPFT